MAVDVGSAVGYLDLDISGFLAGLRSAQSEANTASKNIVAKIGNNLRSAGKSMTSVGSTLAKSVTAPIVGAGTAVFKFSSDFESAMAQVKTIADSDKKSIGAIKDEIVDLSNEAGMAASDLAAATYQAISAGVDTASSVEFVANASKLATAGFTDTTTAVDALTTIINAYGLSAEDATHISDVLISTQNKGKTTVNELAATMGKVIPTANAMGVSLEDLGVAYSYLTAGGIATAESTTYLNGMFNELGKSGTNVSDVLKERTGKSFSELMKGGTSLREVLKVLEAEAQETGVGFNDLWGSQEASKAALALLNTSTEEYNETLKDFQTTIGDTEAAYGIMAETTEYKLNVALQNGKNVLIQLGDTLKAMLLPFIEKGVALLRKLNDWLVNLSREEKEQIVKLAAIAAATGPVLVVLGKLTSSAGSIIATFGKIPGAITKAKSAFTVVSAAIGGTSAPVVAVVAVIGVLIAAFANLWKTNEEFRSKMTAIWDGIKSKFESFAQGIVDRLNALGFDFENFGEVVKATWDGFCSLLAPIFEGVFNRISVILGSVLDTLAGIFDVFVGIFTGNWDQAWQGVKEIFGAVWDLIKGTFESWAIAFKGIADTVLGWFGTTWDEAWTNIKQFFVDTWNGVATFFSNAINAIKTVASNFITTIINFFAQLPGKIRQHLNSAINSCKTWVTQMGQKGREAIDTLLGNIASAASNIGSKVASIGSDIVNGVWSGIQNAAGWFGEQVSGFFSGIVDGVKSVLGIGSPSKVFAKEIGRWLPPGVAQGFEAAMPSAMKAIQKDLNKGIDNIDTDDISVGAGITVSGFADKLKSIYNEVALWFESVESRIRNSVGSTMQSLDVLIRAGQAIVTSDGTLGYIGYNGFTKFGGSEGYVDRTNPKDKSAGGSGDTFNFYSPKAIDEIEAVKQMKKTKQDMAEGF